MFEHTYLVSTYPYDELIVVQIDVNSWTGCPIFEGQIIQWSEKMKYKRKTLIRALLIAGIFSISSVSVLAQREERVRRVEEKGFPELRHGMPHMGPRMGERFDNLPQGVYRSLDMHYFHHRGIWYENCGEMFCVTQPAFGTFLPMLTAAYAVIIFEGQTYYYSNGLYYQAMDGGFVIVQPPKGIESVQPSQFIGN